MRSLTFPRDSALFTRLREFIVPWMRSVVQGDHARVPFALEFVVTGSGASPAWRVLEREVVAAVNGRAVQARDRRKYHIQIGNANVQDTLFHASVEIGALERCGTQWTGSSVVDAVRATRVADGTWSSLTTRESVNADSFGCEVAFIVPEQMPRSAAVMTRLRREHPCPVRLPTWWTAADRSLGKGLRCSLVAAALETAIAPPSAAVAAVDPARVACARVQGMVYVERAARIRHQPAQWDVDFVLGAQSLRVSINAVTGRASARYVDSDHVPACRQ